MEPAAYEHMYLIEDRHWWFVGKRTLVTSLLDDMLAVPDLRLLDVGCGTGGLLAHLGSVANGLTAGVDRSQAALAFCARRGLRSIACADVTRLPFKPSSFDLVLLLDVLEHVSDERSLLREIGTALRPGGTVVVSVPAYQFLWSAHDEVLHHVRRYTATRLARVLGDAGFRVFRLTYTNVAVLLPAVLVRGLLPRFGIRWSCGTDVRTPPRWVNRLLCWLYRAEAALVRRMRFPCGLSVVAVASHHRSPAPATYARGGQVQQRAATTRAASEIAPPSNTDRGR